MKIKTLLFVINEKDQEILLALKKRGFGVGKLNGAGGGVEAGESIEDATVREAFEELQIKVDTKDLIKVAEHFFYFNDHPDWNIHCHVFITYRFDGVPTETDEMAPSWQNLKLIPYDRMWVDDIYWLPQILSGNFINGEFHFTRDGKELSEHKVSSLQRV